jgi:hypothetical protein
MSEELTIACCLSSEELRRREATLIAQFKSIIGEVEEVQNGYAFRMPGDSKSLAIIADLMSAERECCPFLTFQLLAEPKLGPFVLRVTGPAGNFSSRFSSKSLIVWG